MKNLSSYCGLVDAKIRASDKDLPVQLYNLKSYSKLYFEYPCKISHDSKNILMFYTFKNCNVQIKYLAAQLSPNVVQFFEF